MVWRTGHVLAPGVIIQKMVNATAAGVAFSADPLTGDRNISVVAATIGSGSALVSEKQTPTTSHR